MTVERSPKPNGEIMKKDKLLKNIEARTLIKPEELMGKTIVDIVIEEGKLCLHFSDGTFGIFCLNYSGMIQHLTRWGYRTFKIINEDQFLILDEKEKIKYKKIVEERDRKTLSKLIEKYGVPKI